MSHLQFRITSSVDASHWYCTLNLLHRVHAIVRSSEHCSVTLHRDATSAMPWLTWRHLTWYCLPNHNILVFWATTVGANEIGVLAKQAFPVACLLPNQSYISKGIWRQGVGSLVRNSCVSTLCPVDMCPYSGTPDPRYDLLRRQAMDDGSLLQGPQRGTPPPLPPGGRPCGRAASQHVSRSDIKHT